MGLTGLFFSLGILAVTTQVLLLREALVVVSGSELALGIALASWLLGGGLGSLLAASLSRRPGDALTVGWLALSCLAPLLAVLGFRSLRLLFLLPPGLEWQPSQALLGVALVPLLPGALLGACFSLLARWAGPGRSWLPYVGECLGSLAGGMALTFYLLGRLQPMTVALAVTALPGLALLLLAGRTTRWGGCTVLLSLGLAFWAGLPQALEQPTAPASARGLAAQWVQDGRLGRLATVSLGEQRTLYRSGSPTITLPVPPEQLLALDVVLAQHPRPQSVLLVGAQPRLVLQEILRHRPRRLNLVEPDADYLEAILGPANMPAVLLHEQDACQFLRQGQGNWDVILLPLPGPSNLLLNRFYTQEFFQLARSRLSPGGVLAISTLAVSDSLDEERRSLLALLANTLGSVFPQVVTLPMDTTWLVASCGDRLQVDPSHLSARLQARGVAPAGLPAQAVEAVLQAGRADWLRCELSQVDSGEFNRQGYPLAVLLSGKTCARQAANQEESWYGLWLAVLACLSLPIASVLRRRWPRNAGAPLLVVGTGGFTCMTLQLVCLYHFQARYGCLYQALGALVALLMAGMAVGAWSSCHRHPRHWLEGSALALAGLAAVTPLLADSGAPLVIDMMLAGLLAGAQFPTACRVLGEDPASAGWIYGIDLLGSALGAGVVGWWCLPALGTEITCLSTALLGLGVVLAWRGQAVKYLPMGSK